MIRSMHVDDRRELEELDLRLRVLLPETYQDSYESLEPKPMGSAGLKYGPDGKVAWDQSGAASAISRWRRAAAQGTAARARHREAIDAEPARYEEVVDEICRGITLASELPAQASAHAGWVSVDCYSETMASWLLRAIVMENVAARSDGRELLLPAAPHFRARQGNQERHHGHRQDDALLDGAHVARAEERDCGSLREDVAASPLIEPATITALPTVG